MSAATAIAAISAGASFLGSKGGKQSSKKERKRAYGSLAALGEGLYGNQYDEKGRLISLGGANAALDAAKENKAAFLASLQNQLAQTQAYAGQRIAATQAGQGLGASNISGAIGAINPLVGAFLQAQTQGLGQFAQLEQQAIQQKEQNQLSLQAFMNQLVGLSGKSGGSGLLGL